MILLQLDVGKLPVVNVLCLGLQLLNVLAMGYSTEKFFNVSGNWIKDIFALLKSNSKYIY